MQRLDDAHARAEEALAAWLARKPEGPRWRALLVNDVLAKLRVVLWCPSDDEWESSRAEVDQMLRDAATVFWSGSVLQGRNRRSHPDGGWQDAAWRQARPYDDNDRLRILERRLGETGWFEAPKEPPWTVCEPPWAVRGKKDPVIVLFYSFKGGSGRSTALAAAALQLTAAGERVAVVDADLDAPGIGSLLAGPDGAIASSGVVDYLLERRVIGDDDALDISHYHHHCHVTDPAASAGDSAGVIFVFPAWTFNDRYVEKLARIDYGAPPAGADHPFVALLKQIRRDLEPDWILVDARAGLGEVSGFLTGGLCHLHVLFGTLADASWRGLEHILDRIGGDRVRADKPQAECLLAAAMVPRTVERQFEKLVERFTDRAWEVFSERYYADPAEIESPNEFWTLDDLENTDAPHVPVVLPYDERLATFRDLSEVAEPVLLGGEPYRQLVDRLRSAAWWLVQPSWLRPESRRVFRRLRDTTAGIRENGR